MGYQAGWNGPHTAASRPEVALVSSRRSAASENKGWPMAGGGKGGGFKKCYDEGKRYEP